MERQSFLTEQEAADFYGLSAAAMRKRRRLRLPPAYFKIGRTVRYRVDDLAAMCVRHEPTPLVDVRAS